MTAFSWNCSKKRLLTYNVPSLFEKNHRMVMSAIAISLAILIAVIPHLGRQDIKPQGIVVDTTFYSAWVSSLSKSHNVIDLLREAFFVQREGDRPLTLLIIYCLMLVTHLNVAKLIEYFLWFYLPHFLLWYIFYPRLHVMKELRYLPQLFLPYRFRP